MADNPVVTKPEEALEVQSLYNAVMDHNPECALGIFHDVANAPDEITNIRVFDHSGNGLGRDYSRVKGGWLSGGWISKPHMHHPHPAHDRHWECNDANSNLVADRQFCVKETSSETETEKTSAEEALNVVTEFPIQAIADAIEKDPRIVQVKIYEDGWVANSYRWDAPGTAIIYLKQEDGSWIETAGYYDRKRAYAQGPYWSAFSARNGRLAGGLSQS